MTTRLMASVAFGGGLGDPDFTKSVERDFELDPDLAADELRQAGYEVSQSAKSAGRDWYSNHYDR